MTPHEEIPGEVLTGMLGKTEVFGAGAVLEPTLPPPPPAAA